MVNAYRDAPTVVPHRDHVVLFNGHFDVGAVAGQRFVDGVVHNFINQMMQTPLGGGADIHTRPLSDGLQPLQNLDLTFVVGRFYFFYLLDFAH